MAVSSISALSVYSVYQNERLIDAPAIPGAAVSQAPSPPSGNAGSGRALTSPGSGPADAEGEANGDARSVRRFTPPDRTEPLLLDARRVGQDPRMAAQPNPELLEDSEAGRLPVVGPDGLRSMDHYGRPWSGARGTRIAIVVGGLGLSQTGTQKAIQQLPPGVTLAFAASGNSLQRWMQEARRKGHELLLQIPLEPYDYPANNPGPATLLTSRPPRENIVRLHQAMAQITNYTGLMNYQGSRFLSDPKALQPVLEDIAGRGLLFLDDGTSALSKTETVAADAKLPHAFADLVLDGQLQTEAILRKLDDLERIAERKGVAIGVAAAFDESIDAVKQWCEEAAQRGVEIVGVSAIARDREQP